MLLSDVNVVVAAHRPDSAEHEAYRDWLERTINGNEPFGMSELVLSAAVRIVTNPRVFRQPTRLDDALVFVDTIRSARQCMIVSPGPRHWILFMELCRAIGARGNDVPDAYLAALAIESGCEWVTADHGFGRFPGLKWRHPLH